MMTHKTDTGACDRKPIYFIERFRDAWHVRQDHEWLYGIAGGSGLVATFPSRREALAHARHRNENDAKPRV